MRFIAQRPSHSSARGPPAGQLHFVADAAADPRLPHAHLAAVNGLTGWTPVIELVAIEIGELARAGARSTLTILPTPW